MDLKALLMFVEKHTGVYYGGGQRSHCSPTPLLFKDTSAFIPKDATRPDFIAVNSFAAADQGMFPYGKHAKIHKGKNVCDLSGPHCGLEDEYSITLDNSWNPDGSCGWVGGCVWGEPTTLLANGVCMCQ